MSVADSGVVAASDAARLWNEVLGCLRPRIRNEGFETWLAPTKGLKLEGHRLEVEVPNSFFAEWIGQHYSTEIDAALAASSAPQLKVRFRPRDLADAAALRRHGVAEARPEPKPEAYRLNPRHNFGTFVVGESNRLACAAARNVAEHLGANYNPLFIYGGVGLGKTHLIHAIGNHALATRRDIKVYYVAAEALFIELIQSIEKNCRLEFKNKYRQLDLLLLDDIHYLTGKERLQEEVFHTFNHLHDAGSQVVLTSDRPPKDIPTLEERLVSRLGSGLVVDIQPPDLETRVAILKHKAAIEDCEIPHAVACYVAARVSSNVRLLEGCLTRLFALASLTSTPLTIELARQALKDLVQPEELPRQESILSAVAEQFAVTADDLRSPRRTKQLVLARQVAMYFMRRRLKLSLKEIGHCFGDRDHTTVMHAINRVRQLETQDLNFTDMLKDLWTSIGGRDGIDAGNRRTIGTT